MLYNLMYVFSNIQVVARVVLTLLITTLFIDVIITYDSNVDKACEIIANNFAACSDVRKNILHEFENSGIRIASSKILCLK